MFKKWLIILILLLTLTGCYKTESERIFENDNTTSNKSKSIKIITDRSDSQIVKLIENFSKETGIKVELSSIDKWLLDKIENRSEGDVFISKNSSEILAAANKWLLWTIDAWITSNVPDLYKWKSNTWFNMSSRIRAFYIKKWVEDYPTTYEELANPKYKWEICIRKLDHNYNIELISYMLVKHWEEYTKKWLSDFKKNLWRVPSWNDRAQIKGIVEDKDCTIAIANTYYMWLMLQNLEQRDWANSVNLFIPNQWEWEGWAISLYSAIWIAKDIDNKKEVNKLLTFLLDEKTQQSLGSINYEYPIIWESNSAMVHSFTAYQWIKQSDIKKTSITQSAITEVREKALFLIKTIK